MKLYKSSALFRCTVKKKRTKKEFSFSRGKSVGREFKKLISRKATQIPLFCHIMQAVRIIAWKKSFKSEDFASLVNYCSGWYWMEGRSLLKVICFFYSGIFLLGGLRWCFLGTAHPFVGLHVYELSWIAELISYFTTNLIVDDYDFVATATSDTSRWSLLHIRTHMAWA